MELGKTGKELAKKNRKEACERATQFIGIIDEIKALGITAIQRIADELNNNRGIATPKGGKWHRNSIYRVFYLIFMS